MLDALDTACGGGEVGWIGDLEKERRQRAPPGGHNRVEGGELARDPLRVIDALGPERFLQRRADGVAVLEDQRERLAETDAPSALQLGDAVALLAAHALVVDADTHVVEIELDRAFERQEHLHHASG